MLRRRSLLGISRGGVIKDGLILYCDAIQNQRSGHTDTPTDWQDLSGNGNDGVLVGDVQYVDGLYKVDTTAANPSCIKFSSNEILFSMQSSFSLEILFKTAVDCNVMGTLDGSHDNEIGVFSGSQIAARYLARRAPELGTYNINVTGLTLATVTWDFSKNIMNFYFNGKKYHSSANGSATDRNGITLGWRLTGAAQTAVSFFAAVRYYNKVLTDEEVVNNFNYDKRRYNII